MRKRWNFLKTTQWWLVLGALCALCAAVPGIISSINPTDFGDTLYGIVDWLAASVVYFFIGSFFGHFLDWLWRRKITHPDWWWCTLLLWLAGIVLSFLFIHNPGAHFAELLFLPLSYGIFFPAVAYMVLFPGLLRSWMYAKLMLDMIFLAAFAAWLWLSLTKEAGFRKLLRRIFLFFLFAVLLVGMVGCVSQLAAIP